MNKEEIIEKIEEAAAKLDWYDEKIPEIMEGFFNNPAESIENSMDKCTEEHLKSLCESLNIKINE